MDAVVPAHEKDFPVLRQCVAGLLRWVEPVQRVIVVSRQPFPTDDPRVVWVAEPAGGGPLPSLAEARAHVAEHGPQATERVGWVYQQLLKLGADSVIPDLSASYLVVDSDVVFLRRVTFAGDARFVYSRSPDDHEPYIAAYRRLLGADPPIDFACTAHHLHLDRALLGELKAVIEQRHGKPWPLAYLDAVDWAEPSSINEQDTYAQWVIGAHPDLARHRQLAWRESETVPGVLGRSALGLDYDFVACHAYRRRSRIQRATTLAVRLRGELRQLRSRA
jgi:hypothetical protein